MKTHLIFDRDANNIPLRIDKHLQQALIGNLDIHMKTKLDHYLFLPYIKESTPNV